MQIFKTLFQYAPTILIAVGALVAASGGFWQSLRQASFNTTLREKNEDIIRLQSENMQAITGGDSFAEMGIGAAGLGIDAPFTPVFIHHGKFPLYGVAARIVNLDPIIDPVQAPGQMIRNLNGTILQVGDMIPYTSSGGFSVLPHSQRSDRNYNIFFSARNGLWTQQLRWKWNGKEWSIANKIELNGKTVFQEIAPDFPKTADGEPDWGYYLPKANQN